MTSVHPYKLDPTKFPALMQMTETLRANHRFAADIVDRGAALFGEQWATEFEQILSTLFPSPEAVAAAVKGYATFAMHSMRLQAVFERDRQYRPKTHEQASSEVYFNEKHMTNTQLSIIF